jgi:hypothetical protein
MKLFAIFTSAVLIASPAVAAPMQCVFTQKEQCQSGSPCRTIPADRVWTKLDLAAGTYARCEASGCDSHKVQVARGGIWANLTFPGRAMLAKLSIDGNLVEAVTLNDITLISFGKCKSAF